MGAALLTCLVSLAAGGLGEDVGNLEEHAITRDGDDLTAYLHVMATAGAIGAGRNNPRHFGPMVAVGVPLYLGLRGPSVQFLIDSHFSAAAGVRSERLFFVLTPTAGVNFYFLGWLGLELRFGIGLGARWTASQLAAGLGYVVSAAVTLRPFADDHLRFKLGTIGTELIAFKPGGGTVICLSAAAGLGVELRI